MCMCVLREGDMAVSHSNLLLWGTCETWASGWVLSPPTAHLYRLRSVNQSWTTITTWQTVKRKAAI